MKTELLEIKDKKTLKKTSIPVMESFYTLQGEGFHTGKPAWFIRTGGCDVGCVWCDVKESWNAGDHPLRSIDEIVGEVQGSTSEIVIITGGEPLMYDMDILTNAIRAIGKQVHIETSGAHPLSGTWDWICFSPKKFKEPKPEFYKESDELKVVIYHKSDLKWAEEHASKMNQGAKLYLQPEWSKKDSMLPLIINYVKDNPHWRVSLQTHKYMDIP